MCILCILRYTQTTTQTIGRGEAKACKCAGFYIKRAQLEQIPAIIQAFHTTKVRTPASSRKKLHICRNVT